MKKDFEKLLDEFYTSSKKRKKDLQIFNDFLSNKTLCIFGAGVCGMNLYHNLKQNYEVDFFCDNDEKKVGSNIINDIKCISIKDLLKLKDQVVVFVGSAKYSKDIYEQLKKMQMKYVVIGHNYAFNRMVCSENLETINAIEKIKQLFELLEDEASKKVLYKRIEAYVNFENIFADNTFYEDIYIPNQYFPNDIVKITDESSIVDCGAYIGDTLEEFLSLQYPFKNYSCFELNKENYLKLYENIQTLQDNRIKAFNYGVGETNFQIGYESNRGSSTKMQKSKESAMGEIVSLDEFFKEKVSFLKMDIEGAELEALNGAQKLIKKYYPTLAICVYHKFSDLWEIPLWIHQLVPEYQLYLRHHMMTFTETVCYAIKKDK